ncbi:MAG: TIGR04086 family membrane protein [Firmicutes bacterium]|nr:TIGR04086 family membrane protein [Bacillota bacterium]
MEKKDGIIKGYIKAGLYTLVLTLVLVLILALFVKIASPGGTIIAVITQIIKVLAIFYGVGVVTRYVSKRAFIHGAIFGIIYTAVTFLVFSLLATNFDITTGFLYDMLFATVIGVISAFLLKTGRREAM